MKLIQFDWGGAITVYPAHQLLKIVEVKATKITTIRFQGDTSIWELNETQAKNLFLFLSQHENKETPILLKFSLKEKHNSVD